MLSFLSTNKLKNDPRNYAVPLLDVLEDPTDPKNAYLVLPLLRTIIEPPPASVRECIDFMEQTLDVSRLTGLGSRTG